MANQLWNIIAWRTQVALQLVYSIQRVMAKRFDGFGKYLDLPRGKMAQSSGLLVHQKYIVGRGKTILDIRYSTGFISFIYTVRNINKSARGV
ncbi:hypothetical protein [Niabella aquatica]